MTRFKPPKLRFNDFYMYKPASKYSNIVQTMTAYWPVMTSSIKNKFLDSRRSIIFSLLCHSRSVMIYSLAIKIGIFGIYT